jgi:glycerol-3-phosphate dehydrogenase (NAD(P)+)
MKIIVYGSGGWGTAISMLLSANGHSVTLWSAFEAEAQTLSETRENPLLPGVLLPAEVAVTTDGAALPDAELAVLAVPSFAVRETARKIEIAPGGTVVCVSKGIEPGTNALFYDVIADELQKTGKDYKTAILSGPTHAEEVSRSIPTAAVAASPDENAANLVQEAFMCDTFRVYTSNDVVGVELGGALKNIIAIAAGVCDGLGFGDNTIALLVTRGLSEIAELVEKMGGRRETIYGLSGIGDLIVTCTSRHSRNRRAGYYIGTGLSPEEAVEKVGAVVEGKFAAKVAFGLAERFGIEMPISCAAYEVLYKGANARDSITALMTRQKKSEI